MRSNLTMPEKLVDKLLMKVKVVFQKNKKIN